MEKDARKACWRCHHCLGRLVVSQTLRTILKRLEILFIDQKSY